METSISVPTVSKLKDRVNRQFHRATVKIDRPTRDFVSRLGFLGFGSSQYDVFVVVVVIVVFEIVLGDLRETDAALLVRLDERGKSHFADRNLRVASST